MFGKKPQPRVPEETVPVVVHTMPSEFYGGANPVITFKEVAREISRPGDALLTSAEKKSLDKATAAGGTHPWHPAQLFSNRRQLLFIVGGLFVLFVALGAGYYVFFNKPPQVSAPPLSRAVTVETTTLEIPPPVTEASSTVEVPVEALPTTPQESPLEFASTLLGGAADTDNDGLTDKEEELFSADVGVPDSDQDKFTDGHEVYNLYNPAGKEPMKLVDSGLVKEFTNPLFGYRLYYPSSWAAAPLDQTYRQVLFSTINGEYVEVRVFDKEPAQHFPEWFTLRAPTENFSDLVPFQTAFKSEGLRRADWLVYFFETPAKVYVLLYHVTNPEPAHYRSVVKMMARSFRLENVNSFISDRPIETSVTTTPSTPSPLVVTSTLPSGATTTLPEGSAETTTPTRL